MVACVTHCNDFINIELRSSLFDRNDRNPFCIPATVQLSDKKKTPTTNQQSAVSSYIVLVIIIIIVLLFVVVSVACVRRLGSLSIHIS